MIEKKRKKKEVLYQLEKIRDKMENICRVVEENYEEVGEDIINGYPFEGSLNDVAFDLEEWIEKIKKEVK